MRVAYITMQFPVPSETFASNDVRSLRAKGVDVEIYCLRAEHPDAASLLRERNLESVPLSHLTAHSFIRGLGLALARPLRLLDLMVWLVQVSWRQPKHLVKSLLLSLRSLEVFADLEKAPPDVVHIYWGHYPVMVGYLLKRYEPATAMTISLVAYDLEMGYGGTKWLVKHVDKVRTLADINTERIGDIYGVPEKAIEIIYDSVDIARLAPRLAAKTVPKRLITVGRLTKGKGMAEVVDSFAAVLKEHSDATLAILGDGPERVPLEKRCEALGIAHAVTFFGHVNHDQVLEEMAEADLLLFMSRNKAERLPNVVKEAMFAECICVVSDTIGIRELIPNNSYGFVVPIGDVEAATERVLAVLKPEFEREPIRATAKAHIVENFSLEHAAEQYIAMWQRLMARDVGQQKSTSLSTSYDVR